MAIMFQRVLFVFVVLASLATITNAQTLTTLLSFSGSNGAEPWGSLILSGSTLYGTTTSGGNLSLNGGYGFGTVFSVPVTGGTSHVLCSFNGNGVGTTPMGG